MQFRTPTEGSLCTDHDRRPFIEKKKSKEWSSSLGDSWVCEQTEGRQWRLKWWRNVAGHPTAITSLKTSTFFEGRTKGPAASQDSFEKEVVA